MLSTRAKRIRRLTFSVCRRINENDFVTPFRASAAALIEATRTRNTSSQLHRFVGETEQDFNRSGALSVLTLQQRAASATVDFVRCRAREILPVLYVPTYSDYSRVQYNNRILLSRSRSTWLPLRKSR
ncbi:unnamed protein product [Aphis gossypii]|uniref:Uncharacterized protein n=1 Tax=Aphis gossypii TaxID=80765 RepID=A0A9P0J5R0_APHGO|nr:unnamed protein product [Aphis gossypii]